MLFFPPASLWSLELFCQQILFLTFASLHTFKALKNSCNFSLSPALQNTDSIWQETLPLTPTEIPGLGLSSQLAQAQVGGFAHSHFSPLTVVTGSPLERSLGDAGSQVDLMLSLMLLVTTAAAPP